MRIYFLIVICLLISRLEADAVTVTDDCYGVFINDVYHIKKVLVDELDRPYNLVCHKKTNTIYFSYSLHPVHDFYQSAFVNVDTKAFGNITGIPNGFANAIDEKNDMVYIGSSDGIYRYDIATRTVDFYGAKGVDIWSVFHKDILYYSQFPSEILYTIIDDESVRYKPLQDTKVDRILIDDRGNFFFKNDSGLYLQKKDDEDNDVSEMYDDELNVRGLAIDRKGQLYVAMMDGLYVVLANEKRLTKLVNIDDTFGVTLDAHDNIVYSDGTSIIKLLPDYSSECRRVEAETTQAPTERND